jgi:hypothetical protein
MTSSDEEYAQQEARCCVDVCNAVIAAQDFNRTQCACGIAIMSAIIAGDDPVAKLALAKEMAKLIEELEPGFMCAGWQ